MTTTAKRTTATMPPEPTTEMDMLDASWQRSPVFEAYRSDYESLDSKDALGERVGRARRAAWEHFSSHGFPGRREEEWRHTDIGVVRATPYRGHREALTLEHAQIEPFLYRGCHHLVVVNGRVSHALSDSMRALEGALISAFESLDAGSRELVETRLATAARSDHPFVALNTALFRDGLVIDLPKGCVLDRPLHVLVLSAHALDQPQVAYPRLLINARERSEATIIETYASLDDEPNLTCPVTEVFCGPGSVLRHYKVQKEGLEAAHMATMHAEIERDAQFSSQSISHGGGLVRNDTRAALRGPGSDATLNGLYVVGGDQVVDNHMLVEHEAPNTTSHELFKGILSDRARAVFNGRIYVHRSAQKTDAKQTNRNLLLSDRALINSNPQLEIFADDVRCTHGSTTGHLEAEALFYLRSRGIGADAATSLLTYAFASEFVELVEVKALREDLQEFLFSRLPGGEIVRQAV